jgi:dihydroflavonol-4-reductase
MGLNLVIGGNGHLGCNILKILDKKKKNIRTSIRNEKDKDLLKQFNCEIVLVDILNKDSLEKAMEGVDTVYIAAAVYKSWARNPQEEIIDVNVQSTINIFKAAAKQKVKKIIYIGSTLTLDHDNKKINEHSKWNEKDTNPYTISKVEAEKIAWKLAKQYNIKLISILPSAMIGTNIDNHLTPSSEFLNNVLKNKVPFDPGFYFNYIDVEEAAKAIVTAGEKCETNSRYILGQENFTTSTEVFTWAHELFPEVKIPKKANIKKLYFIATIMEFISKITKKKPLLQKNQIKQFSQANYNLDISKAKKELDFKPSSPKDTIQKAFKYLKKNM